MYIYAPTHISISGDMFLAEVKIDVNTFLCAYMISIYASIHLSIFPFVLNAYAFVDVDFIVE